MGELIELAEPLIILGQDKRSFLPDAIRRYVAGRNWYIPENGRTLEESNDLIAASLAKVYGSGPIFIDRSGEVGHMTGERLEWLRRTCRSLGLDIGRIVYVSQSPAAAPKEREAPRSIAFHHYLLSTARVHAETTEDFDYGQGQSRVLLLNRKVRPHRIALAASLAASGLSDRVDMSWCGSEALHGLEKARTDAAAMFPGSGDAIRDWTPPPERNFRHRRDRPWATEEIVDEVRGCFMELVAETDIGASPGRVTEKILKPVAGHRPFIVFGPPGSLARLRSYGFRTFGHVIDESYDSLELPDARLKAVIASLGRAMADPETIASECREVCAYNQNHLRTGLEPALMRMFEQDVTRLLAAA